jgi:gliding motility-associated-like protein
MTVSACFDTRPPDVNIICPPLTVDVGSDANISWTVHDMNPHLPCSLFANWGTGSSAISVYGYNHNFRITPENSRNDSIRFIVEVKDSFCNISWDTCWVHTRSWLNVVLRQPTTDYVSCDGQNIRWFYNTPCGVNRALSSISVDAHPPVGIPSGFVSLSDTSISFTPGTGYWTSGTHTIAMHLVDSCGNTFDSVFTFLFDVDKPYFPFFDPLGMVTDSFSYRFIVRDSTSGIDSLWYRVSSDCGTATYYYPSLTIRGDTLITPRFYCYGDNRICVFALDNGTICPPNPDSLCWTVNIPEPGIVSAVLIRPLDTNGDGNVVSSCIDERFIWVINHSEDLDLSSIRIASCEGDIAYPDARLTLSGDTLTYRPALTHGMLCSAFLTEIEDVFGGRLPAPVGGSVIIDREPPYMLSSLPADQDTIYTRELAFNASFTDDICGTSVLTDSIRATVYPSGSVFFSDRFPLMIAGLESYDSVVVRMYGRDNCADYCGGNAGDTTVTFHILLSSLTVTLVEPIDIRSDGRVISSCPGQGIVWHIESSLPLETSEIEVIVDGITYRYPDHLSLSPLNDTLYWTPSSSFSHGDSIYACVRHIGNIIGFALINTACGSFIFDMEPPVVSRVSGTMPGETVRDSLAGGVFSSFDAICGTSAIDSVTIVTRDGRIDTTFYGTSWIMRFENNDTVTVCAYSLSDCEDYDCLDSVGYLCYDFYVRYGGVSALLEEPVDYNDDGRILSACHHQRIVFSYSSMLPVDHSGIVMTVNGTRYTWGAPELSTSADSVIFTPSLAWVHGSVISFCLENLPDFYGNDLTAPVCGSFRTDFAPPYLVSVTPLTADTIYGSTANIRMTFSDSVCSSILIDTCWAVSTSSGLSTGGRSFPLSLSGLVDGDTVNVMAIVRDYCNDYCINASILRSFFTVMMGEPYGEFILPEDRNMDGLRITTCNDMGFAIRLYDSHGLDSTRFSYTVGSTTYTSFARYEASGTGEELTCFYTPDRFWTNGEMVRVRLDEAYNTIGDALVTPVIESFLVDLAPPVISIRAPSGLWTYDTARVRVTVNDAICGSSINDSTIITTSSGSIRLVLGAPVDVVLAGLADGDTVSVCTWAADNCADTCEANDTIVCRSFYIMMGEPFAEIISPRDSNDDGRIITNCTHQGFIARLTDSHGMTTDGLSFTVDGIRYHESDLDSVSYSPDSSVIHIFWTPDISWDASSSVLVVVDSAYNTLGDALFASDSLIFIVDLTPPSIIPNVPTGEVILDRAVIGAAIYDSLCGASVSRDSIVITTSISGMRIVRRGSFTDSLITGFTSGDIVTVCIFTSDACADTCGFNSGDTCLSFNVNISEITARIIYPVDVNGDGIITSACNDMSMRFVISHSRPLIPESTVVNIDLFDYRLSSAELEMFGDTIVFTTLTPWEDDEVVHFCLMSAMDDVGATLTSAVCAEMTFDISPPYPVFMLPLDGAFIMTDSIVIDASFEDEFCGLYLMDSLSVMHYTSSGGTRTVYTDSPLTVRGLSDGDSLRYTYFVRDTCNDYCENDTFYSAMIRVVRTAPVAEIIYPVDVNYDGRIISNCDDLSMGFVIRCEHGVSTDGLIMNIQGTLYDGTEADSLIYNPDSTVLYVWLSHSVPFTDGEVVNFSIEQAESYTGTPLHATVSGSFILDLSPPVISVSVPVSPVTTDTASFTWSVYDTICGVITPDSVVVISTLTGRHSIDIMPPHTLSGLSDGERITVRVYSHDGCADYCEANYSQRCDSFAVNIGSLSAFLIFPEERDTITSCSNQGVVLGVNAIYGLDLSTIRISAMTDTFGTGSYVEVSASSDSIYFVPPFDFFSHGDSTEVCLISVSDIYGGSLSGRVCKYLIADLRPPSFSLFSPISEITDRLPVISVNIADDISGVNPHSVILTLNGEVLSTVFNGTTASSSVSSNLVCGQSYTVCITASDSPRLCEPNTATECWDFSISCPVNLSSASILFSPPSSSNRYPEGETVFPRIFFSNSGVNDISSFAISCTLNDTLIFSFRHVGLLAGISDTMSIHPMRLNAGEYRICLFVDSEHEHIETDEADNRTCSDFVIYTTECSAVPNPFTPNNDMVYDEVFFSYPLMGLSGQVIDIYDLSNRLVKSIKEGNSWDGKDDKGNAMPKGVYIYLVRREGKTLCQGTIYLAR